jgi:diguanylate cyclase (GGDEF)-like protein
MWLAKTIIQRNVGIPALVLLALVGGTWAAVKITTDHLLNKNATSTAYSWAQYLVANLADLEQIAAGEQPLAGSMAFFQGVRNAGPVFRYEIYNREGYSQFVSDHDKIAFVDLSEYSANAARAVTIGAPVVDTTESGSADLPSFFARAYVPVLVNGRTIAVVAAFVDQTEPRRDFYNPFLAAAASLCGLIGISFGIPAIAWYRRTLEKQKGDRRLRFLAHHDALTSLSNRAHLIERFDAKLARLSPGDSLAVHFIDLDRFKEVNDTLGHDAGDFVLKTVAKRLRAAVRMDDVVARLGGDEFVVLQTGVTSSAQVEAFADRLSSALTVPIQYREHEMVAAASIGVAVAPADGKDPERLLKCADLALYKGKAAGRSCVRFFLPEMDSELQHRLLLEKTIRDAVLHDRFELHYQPVFEISGRRLIGFEALLRLTDMEGTPIPPSVFIPVAEEIRLIGEIGAWVLQEASRTAMTWPAQLTIAVNLSPAQFEGDSVSDIVGAALRETGLAPHRLELEITESLLLGDNKLVMAELTALKSLGVAIVMDDFGTGYSSLSYLWRFPFDKIKIDRSFMEGFDHSRGDAETVVKTIIALGRELRMHVTVEGVETREQADFLDHVDADLVQGYFFGRPVPASEIAADLLANFQKMLPTQPATSAPLAKHPPDGGMASQATEVPKLGNLRRDS